jgi:hypothetical protein
MRGFATDELAALVIVGVGEERLHGDVDKIGIAVELFAVGIGKL